MKGQYQGPMSIDDLFQALWQDRCFFRRHGIKYIRSARLYFTPCDEYGGKIAIYDPDGNPVGGYISAGSYRSAAERYDSGLLEPQTVIRQALPVFRPEHRH